MALAAYFCGAVAEIKERRKASSHYQVGHSQNNRLLTHSFVTIFDEQFNSNPSLSLYVLCTRIPGPMVQSKQSACTTRTLPWYYPKNVSYYSREGADYPSWAAVLTFQHAHTGGLSVTGELRNWQAVLDVYIQDRLCWTVHLFEFWEIRGEILTCHDIKV